MLVSIPAVLFPLDLSAGVGRGKQLQPGAANLSGSFGVLVQGLGRKLLGEDTRLPAFMALQKIADVLAGAGNSGAVGGPKSHVFHTYLTRSYTLDRH